MPAEAVIDVGAVVAGTYEVTGLLGRGGMGTVWAARHLRLPGKRVAIKILLGGAHEDAESYARFRREAEIASRLGHPNIVEVLDFNTLPDGTPYLVLEHLDGESLASRLRRGVLPVAAALDVARQIGSALAAAHRAGVVHRDLKPENVFLCPTDAGGVLHDRVKVLDFGISKIRGSETVKTQDAVLVGTPQYMSPEQATGKNQAVDARTDVFALGVLVYEMLAGAAPFAGGGGGLAEIVFRIVYQPAAPLGERAPGTPAEVVAAVERAMAKDPAERFPDVGSLVQALTGRPLQTLERAAAPAPASPTPVSSVTSFAPTAAAPPAPPPGVSSTAPTVAAAGLTTTMPRGEVTSPVAPPAGRRSLSPRIAGVAVAIAVVVVAASSALRSDPPPAAPPPRAAARPPIATPSPTPRPEPTPIIGSPGHGMPPPSPAATQAPVPSPLAPEPTPPDKTIRRAGPGAPATLPPEAAADLDEAKSLLAAGKPAEAVRAARHSLYAAKSSRAYAVMTRAFCKQADLANAKASLASVRPADRARVVADCRTAGVDMR